MKNTGIVRHLDPLGRIVLPKELRRTLGLNEGDPIEIYVQDEKVILEKYEPQKQCTCCVDVVASAEHKFCFHCGRKL